jgi:hypothetical protein
MCLPSRSVIARPGRQTHPLRLHFKVTATASSTMGGDSVASKENFKGEVLDPSVFNKNWVRLGAVAVAVVGAARGTGFLPAHVAACVHLLSFSINLGMIFWVSFSLHLPSLLTQGHQANPIFDTSVSHHFPKKDSV